MKPNAILRRVMMMWGAALGTGCAVDPGPNVSEIVSASTVGDYASTGCSTAVVIGLATQIVQQVNCEHPGTFVPFTAGAGITFASSAVVPFLDKSASDDLAGVGETDPLTITSGLRTLAQQYLLYSWSQQSMCGITADATVGNSTHEGGRAVDVSNYASVIADMSAHGWAHDVAAEPLHFDHTSSPANQGYDVHAFQVLWNLNNPGDQLVTDGVYGSQTGARLAATPATGFAMGPTCDVMMPPPGTHDVEVVSIAGPERALPKVTVHYAIVLKNTGTIDWPATTQLTLATDTASQLHDMSWTSATVVTTLGTAVPAGQMVTVAFNVTTPDSTQATPVAETFALEDGATKFGMIDLALTVAPNGGGSGSGSGSGSGVEMGHASCDAGGGAGGSLLLVGLASMLCMRSRRRCRADQTARR
jgi:hypothetical protein